MQIYTAFLLAGFLVLATGGGQALCRLTGFTRGTLAALCLLIAAGAAFTVPLGPVSVNIGAALVYALGIRGCLRTREKLFTFLTAGFGGLVGFIVLRSFYAAAEPGLIMAVPMIALSPVALRFPREGAAAACIFPLFYAFWLAVEELCLFERFALSVGSAAQLDAFVLSVAAMAVLRTVQRFFAGLTRKNSPESAPN